MINRDEEAIRSQLTFMQLQLTKYSAHSVLRVAHEVLSETKPWTFQDVQTIPWHTLLIVKWVMQNPNCKLYLGQTITRREFDSFRQRAWDLTGPAKAGAPNVYAMLRSILPAQIEFQRRSPWGFMRWACLTARLPAAHPSRHQFMQELQISPEEFVDACLILHPPILNGDRTISVEWINAIVPVYKDAVLRLLHLLGTDFLGLRSALSEHWNTYTPSSWELFELPFVRKLPFLLTPTGAWQIWHPAMFERALEDAVHLVLTPLKGEYTQIFSLVFEEYVVELAKEVWADLIDEAAWKEVMGHNAPAVEGIVPLGPINVFVESKMSLFHDAVIIDDSPENLASRLERVIEAIKQAWKVSQLLRQRPRSFPPLADATEEFLLVVTSRELHVGGGVALQRLLPPATLDCADDALAKRLLPENIFVISIESFEHLQGIVRNEGINIADLLRSAAAANRDPATSVMYFDDHIKKYAKAGWPVVRIVEQHREEAMERLKKAFDSPDPTL